MKIHSLGAGIPQSKVAGRAAVATSQNRESVRDLFEKNDLNANGFYKPPKLSNDKGGAVAMVGMGVMMTSVMVAAAMANKWSPALMIGGMFAGFAIMAASD